MNDTKTQHLCGHSGCKIYKMRVDCSNDYIVRKISSNKKYNQRLEDQIKKQAAFRSPLVKAPQVLNTGYTEDGLLYVDMEYIEGQVLSEYVKTHTIEDILPIIDNLLRMNLSSYGTRKSNVDVIQDKIQSLERALTGYEDGSPCKRALKFLSSFAFATTACQCHGDLTFENIIVTSNKRIYIIDFLDSFQSSYEIDASKLMQDACCGWSYRYENIDEETCKKLCSIGKFIEATYKDITASKSSDQLYAMLLLTLLRIYPYAHDRDTINFLDNKIVNIMARFDETGGDL